MKAPVFIIKWVNKETGRRGFGTKRFERDAAELLALELNIQYPNFTHEAVSLEDAKKVEA